MDRFPTNEQIVFIATAGMAAIQLISLSAGVSPETAALRGAVALVGIAVVGFTAKWLIGTSSEPQEPSESTTLGTRVDLKSEPETSMQTELSSELPTD